MIDESTKILFVAFACEPGRGSEPGVGWNFVDEASKRRPVWVLTDASFRKPLDQYLRNQHRHFPIYPIYVSLPGMHWLWNSHLGINLYYYFWQFLAARAGRRAHREIHFDLVQHVSFERYWMHSAAASIGPPFIFGPVGGGETWPKALIPELNAFERIQARAWYGIRTVMEYDPLLKKTLRNAAAIIPSIQIVSQHLKRLGVEPLEPMVSVAPKPNLPVQSRTAEGSVFRFISIGRMPRWKGVHLGIQAFAAAFGPASNQPTATVEYLILGTGSELNKLKKLAKKLNVDDRIQFLGDQPYNQCIETLSTSHAMIHPTLRDSAGLIFESLMMGVPVACLDVGLPGLVVDQTSGAVISVEGGTSQIIAELAKTMLVWYSHPTEYRDLRQGAKRRAEKMSREKRGEALEKIHEDVLRKAKPGTVR